MDATPISTIPFDHASDSAERRAARLRLEQRPCPQPRIAVREIHHNRDGKTFLVLGLRNPSGETIYAYASVAHRIYPVDLALGATGPDIVAIEIAAGESLLANYPPILAKTFVGIGPAAAHDTNGFRMTSGHHRFLTEAMIAGLRSLAKRRMPALAQVIVEQYLADREAIRTYTDDVYAAQLGVLYTSIAREEDEFGPSSEIDPRSLTPSSNAYENISWHQSDQIRNLRIAHLRNVHHAVSRPNVSPDPFQLPGGFPISSDL